MSFSLSPQDIQFIESGVSLGAASRDRRYVPSVARVLACRVEPDAKSLRILLSRQQAAQLIQDALSSDQLALVLSDPPTHKTWQIKGHSVSELPCSPQDSSCIAGHIDAFAGVIEALDFPRPFTKALYAHVPEDVVCLRFVIAELFDQSPGPRAGMLLSGQQGAVSA